MEKTAFSEFSDRVYAIAHDCGRYPANLDVAVAITEELLKMDKAELPKLIEYLFICKSLCEACKAKVDVEGTIEYDVRLQNVMRYFKAGGEQIIAGELDGKMSDKSDMDHITKILSDHFNKAAFEGKAAVVFYILKLIGKIDSVKSMAMQLIDQVLGQKSAKKKACPTYMYHGVGNA